MIPAIRVASSPEELAHQAAERIVRASADAMVATDRFVIALSGGSTPRRLFELLAADYVTKIQWAKVHVLFVDERCVPPDHADSNFGMACRTLLDHVPIAYENIRRMPGEQDPQQAADAYEQLLREEYARGVDLALLGMGEDGHTASLFPQTPALQERGRLCVANYVEKLSAWRLTMTAEYLNRAFEVLVLVEGAKKAPVVARVLEGGMRPGDLPIQLISPVSGRLIWLMDSQAAGMGNADESGRK